MLFQSTETYVAWAAGLLFVGGILMAMVGLLALARARRLPYFQLRRQSILLGWQRLMLGIGIMVLSGLVFSFGRQGVELIVPPTPTATLTPRVTATPTVTASSTTTATPSLTLSPTNTLTPTATVTPTATPTPSLTPTPRLPVALITPPGTVTVTPPANALAANLRFRLDDNCTRPGQESFDTEPKTIYAIFDYDNWLPGVQWSGVWIRDGEIFFVETLLWDGSTGGCGFSNYDNGEQPWPAGTYEVQIFIGDQWLVSNQFVMVPPTPTPTFTPSRTPRPTETPTLTRTPRPTVPTATPSVTRTPRPTITSTHTNTFTPTRPTATPSLTRTRRPTITSTYTNTPTPTRPTPTPSRTRTRRPTITSTPTDTPRPTRTATPTRTRTPSATATR